MPQEPGEGNPEEWEKLQAATQRATTQGSGEKVQQVYSKELNQKENKERGAGTRSRRSVPNPRMGSVGHANQGRSPEGAREVQAGDFFFYFFLVFCRTRDKKQREKKERIAEKIR